MNLVKSFRNSKGFTLMEVLIVLVVLAVIVGLAVPIYQSTAKKTYKAEALNILSALRQSQARFYQSQSPRAYTSDISLLDFDPNSVSGTAHFTYTVTTGSGVFTASAIGSTGLVSGSDNVTINNVGTIGGNM